MKKFRDFRAIVGGSLLLTACCSGISPAAGLVDNGTEFYDFSVLDSTSPQFQKNFMIIGNKSLVSFVKTEGKQVMRLKTVTRGTDDTTEQSQVVGRQMHGWGTYAALMRFDDSAVCGKGGDRPVQAFYLSSPEKDEPRLFSEVDFEYLPHGGWGNYKTPKLHLTSWDAFGNGVRKVTNTPLDGSFHGWHLLVVNSTPDEVKMSVDGKTLASYKKPYTQDSQMRLAWRLRTLTQGRVESSELRCYQMDVAWALFAGNKYLNSDEVKELVKLRSPNY